MHDYRTPGLCRRQVEDSGERPEGDSDDAIDGKTRSPTARPSRVGINGHERVKAKDFFQNMNIADEDVQRYLERAQVCRASPHACTPTDSDGRTELAGSSVMGPILTGGPHCGLSLCMVRASALTHPLMRDIIVTNGPRCTAHRRGSTLR